MTEQNVNIEDEAPEVGNPEVEETARRFGWKPKEDWVGDDTNWRDAESFMQQGHIVAKQLEGRLSETQREAEERVARLERESAERFARLDAMHKQAAELRQKNHAREIDRIKAEMKVAVEEGDTARFERLQSDRDALDAEREEAEAPKPAEVPNDPPPEHRAAFERWVNANPWFQTNPEMNGAANGFFASIKDNGKSLDENLTAVTERMKELYPREFGVERRAKVDGGGLAGGRRGKGVAELPPEAKKAARDFIEDGLYESLEEYAKEYWAQEV